MKALITRTALLLMMGSTFGPMLAAEPPADPLRANILSPQERALKDQINRYVTYPLMEQKRAMDGEVLVNFVINTVGKVTVISATSENPELQAYVLRKLERIDIGDNPSGTWKTEHIRFVFRPEA